MVAVLALVVATTAGCGGIGELLAHYDRESTSPTAPSRSPNDIVAMARPSVVKVRGRAESCDKILEGSGFVVAPHKVMTNAHVIAGADAFSVDADGKPYTAQVISYDPEADISILDVPDLPAGPLRFAEYTAGTGTDVLVLGYPGAHAFTASAAQVREVTELSGPDIYHSGSVTREVYILMGSFPQAGSSGSVIVDYDGAVLGVYFGADSKDSTTGFALTAAQVAPQLSNVVGTQSVETGDCVT